MLFDPKHIKAQSASGGCSPITHSDFQRRRGWSPILCISQERVRWKKCCRLVDTLGNYSLEMLQGLGASPVHKACEHFYNMCPAGTSCWEGIQTALRRWHPFRKPPRKGNLHTLAYNEKKKMDSLKGVPLLNKSRLPDCAAISR